jgi:hypothetical protein
MQHKILYFLLQHTEFFIYNRKQFAPTSRTLRNCELGSVAGHLVFCSVIIKPRIRAPHGAGWPLPPFCGGPRVAMAVYGTEGRAGGRMREEKWKQRERSK